MYLSVKPKTVISLTKTPTHTLIRSHTYTNTIIHIYKSRTQTQQNIEIYYYNNLVIAHQCAHVTKSFMHIESLKEAFEIRKK